MQNRLWQLLVLVPLFSTQLTVQSSAEELPGKPENKTKGIPYAAHPEVQHHSKAKEGAGTHHLSKVKQAAGQSKSEGSAKTEGADTTESKATKP